MDVFLWCWVGPDVTNDRMKQVFGPYGELVGVAIPVGNFLYLIFNFCEMFFYYRQLSDYALVFQASRGVRKGHEWIL